MEKRRIIIPMSGLFKRIRINENIPIRITTERTIISIFVSLFFNIKETNGEKKPVIINMLNIMKKFLLAVKKN